MRALQVITRPSPDTGRAEFAAPGWSQHPRPQHPLGRGLGLRFSRALSLAEALDWHFFPISLQSSETRLSGETLAKPGASPPRRTTASSPRTSPRASCRPRPLRSSGDHGSGTAQPGRAGPLRSDTASWPPAPAAAASTAHPQRSQPRPR